MNEELVVLQLHYYLRGQNNHSMNATVHNECERCFVHAILSLNKYVNGALSVEIYAAEELGGIKNKYKVLINRTLVGLGALASISQVLSYFGVFFTNPNASSSLETLTRIEVVEKIKSKMDSEEPFTEEEFDYIASNDKDLRKLKSEYFKAALKDNTIESIEVNEIKSESETQNTLGIIHYADFQKCIIPKGEETESDEFDTIIYIISPVLVKGRGNSWRGVCDGASIDFKVTDKEFLNNVYNHTISFSNGTYIRCKMRVTQKMNLNNNSLKISREVFEVYEVNDDDNMVSCKITHKTKSKIDPLQQSLFDNAEFN